MSQRYFLKHGPRNDLSQGFYPNKLSTHRPALLNSMHTLTAAMVSAIVFREVAKKGGSQVGATSVNRLIAELERALDPNVLGHCRAEAEAVLDWIEFPPEPTDGHVVPELKAMREADVASRLRLAQTALDGGLDLELQYFDADTERWPQRRVTPLRVDHSLEQVVFDNGTSKITVDAKHIRWLMPVTRHARPLTRPVADVLAFPSWGADAEE